MKKHVVEFFRFLEKKEGVKVSIRVKLLNFGLFAFGKDELDYKGTLYLSDTSISSLPDGLQVGGNLYLSNTFISSLPDRLKVGGRLHLEGTPIAKMYGVDDIRSIIEASGGYVNGKIFV